MGGACCGTGYGYGYPPRYGGVIDADPITPGIQSTPGIVTPVGPPTIAGGYAPLPYRPAFGGVSTVGFGGPTTIIPGGVGYPGAGFGGFNRGIDLDPISPGIQTRPGVVTATGPTRFGY